MVAATIYSTMMVVETYSTKNDSSNEHYNAYHKQWQRQHTSLAITASMA